MAGHEIESEAGVRKKWQERADILSSTRGKLLEDVGPCSLTELDHGGSRDRKRGWGAKKMARVFGDYAVCTVACTCLALNLGDLGDLTSGPFLGNCPVSPP